MEEGTELPLKNVSVKRKSGGKVVEAFGAGALKGKRLRERLGGVSMIGGGMERRRVDRRRSCASVV